MSGRLARPPGMTFFGVQYISSSERIDGFEAHVEKPSSSTLGPTQTHARGPAQLTCGRSVARLTMLSLSTEGRVAERPFSCRFSQSMVDRHLISRHFSQFTMGFMDRRCDRIVPICPGDDLTADGGFRSVLGIF